MKEFAWPVRVYYEDTDSGGVVYYANYLRFMERARTECLRHFGFEQDELIAEQGIIFAVRAIEVDYLRPARFNDLLQIRTTVAKVGGASVTFAQQIARGDELLCQGSVKVASLDTVTMRPRPLPPELYTAMDEMRI